MGRMWSLRGVCYDWSDGGRAGRLGVGEVSKNRS